MPIRLNGSPDKIKGPVGREGRQIHFLPLTGGLTLVNLMRTAALPDSSIARIALGITLFWIGYSLSQKAFDRLDATRLPRFSKSTVKVFFVAACVTFSTLGVALNRFHQEDIGSYKTKTEANTFDQGLREAIKNDQKRLPAKIDDHTTLVYTWLNGKALEATYDLTGTEARNLDRDALTTQASRAFCQQPEIGKLFDAGYHKVIYYTVDGVPFVKLKVDRDSCALYSE